MPVVDVFARIFGRPAGKVVEASVRELVEELLRQKGFARPEDVAAVRGEAARVTADLHGLRNRVGALADALSEVQRQAEQAWKATESLQTELDAARARIAELEARPAAAVPAPAPAPVAAPVAAAVSAPAEDDEPGRRGRKSLSHLGCKVAGCEEAHRSKGFCSKHYQAWRRGHLDGFVGPEGMIEHDGKALRVDASLQGEPVKVSGKGADLKVKVNKDVVAHTAI